MGEGRFARFFRRCDGPADHQVVGAGGDACAGVATRAWSSVDEAAGRMPGTTMRNPGPAGFADGADFVRRGHHTIEARSFGELREGRPLAWQPDREADFGERAVVHAGENRHTEQHRALFTRAGGFPRGAHHRRAAARVQREQLHSRQARGRGYAVGDGVGDVVKFQVEEDSETKTPRAFSRLAGLRR